LNLWQVPDVQMENRAPALSHVPQETPDLR